ncbi:MAG TPA: adenine deaminase [Thermoanaerobaculia bacterium]|nr:adenine deaminase [Thermoanaerobaculia bacterium]
MSSPSHSVSEQRARLLAVARGDEPADLVLAGGRVLDVFTGDVVEADVAICGERIAGVGRYRGREVVELGGAWLLPGLIDAHVHVESSMVPPAEMARAVVPRGTTTIVADPHEIANVLGVEGVRWMLADADGAPFEMVVMAPSCVPASHLATSGATLGVAELSWLAAEPRVRGLAEVMSFPAVVAGDPEVLAKVDVFAGRPIDGHAPGLSGAALAAYAAAGPRSDHECTTVEEAREKLRAGLVVFLRQATNAQNLRDLLPLVDARTERRLCLCTDDRQPADLLDEGHMDALVRMAIDGGVDPLVAIRMVTLNTAEHFGLHDRGAVAPGRRADLLACRDLADLRPHRVWHGGRLVAKDGELLDPALPGSALRGGGPRLRPPLPPSVRVDWERVDFALRAEGKRARVLGLIPDQLVTRHLVEEVTVKGGVAVADPARDLLRMAVVERHVGSGRVGQGFVRGLGLVRGAIASTVAHDHHNLVVAGADTLSMESAARRAAALGGGLVAAVGEEVLAEVPLPYAGLMSDRPIEEVRRELDRAIAAAHELGSPLRDPFMALSFAALEVIPSLKLTDRGLVDVDRFELVPLWVD